ncbi:Predicted erythritol ABC transporter 2, hypothetical lipoprotein [Halomonas citrativorans]|uniref:Predicted erythritol ABC transporter 2, hypothetical lipoprotein n=1 Tax=Halomonas citrativorans TaxID=2742612 RepID=A0A1R4HSS3_9GAMM|nr:DUF2291 family protein [Halomonas citrativorans]SJN10621.1 Predicted erythritol ABC transporter 2, hypothetical lipoprotein [Halomonas citrativorans]
MPATLNSLPANKRMKVYVAGVCALALMALMAFDTKVLSLAELEGEVGFSPENFAQQSFPEIKEYIETNAVEANVLAPEALESAGASGKKYGVPSGIGHVIPVTLTGVVVDEKSGIYTVNVADMSDEIVIRVQAGSAINGTTLRDTTGDIQFSDFTNQIEYQNAGAALNEEMKRQILSEMAGQDLTGKTLVIAGSFNMINPKNWLITPVSIAITD